MSTDDRSLADEAPQEAIPTVDATTAPQVEDFDFEEFLRGARPTRRAVEVFARADLVADLEEIAAEYDRAEADRAPAAARKEIADRFTRVREQFYESGRWFVLEARSAERVEKVRREAAARHGIALPPDDAQGDDALIPRQQWDKLERAILADSVVSPTAVSEDALARMSQQLPTEYVKLVVAMRQANSRLAQSADVMSRDFSPARSGKSGTAGSRRR